MSLPFLTSPVAEERGGGWMCLPPPAPAAVLPTPAPTTPGWVQSPSPLPSHELLLPSPRLLLLAVTIPSHRHGERWGNSVFSLGSGGNGQNETHRHQQDGR